MANRRCSQEMNPTKYCFSPNHHRNSCLLLPLLYDMSCLSRRFKNSVTSDTPLHWEHRQREQEEKAHIEPPARGAWEKETETPDWQGQSGVVLPGVFSEETASASSVGGLRYPTIQQASPAHQHRRITQAYLGQQAAKLASNHIIFRIDTGQPDL